MKQLTKRLLQGQDLRQEIENFVKEQSIKAGVIVSMVGSLEKVTLRMIGGKAVKTWDEPMEIVSCTGTISENGCHIHISASNIDGITYGGHLKEGCVVKTTVELVVLIFDDVAYDRQADEKTGYDELVVK